MAENFPDGEWELMVRGPQFQKYVVPKSGPYKEFKPNFIGIWTKVGIKATDNPAARYNLKSFTISAYNYLRRRILCQSCYTAEDKKVSYQLLSSKKDLSHLDWSTNQCENESCWGQLERVISIRRKWRNLPDFNG